MNSSTKRNRPGRKHGHGDRLKPRLLRLIQELRDTTASIYFLPDFFVFDLVAARFDYVSGIPVVAIFETPFYGVNAILKRALDLILGTIIVVLVAPVIEQYRKLIPGYMLRHKVKPGITGWAQINGLRGETETLESMKRRVDLDIDHLNNWSPSLDL